MSTQVEQVALPLRSHTLLGVCEAIGEDFGFNPIFLRTPLAASVIYSPIIAIGAYLLLGIAVFVSRYFFPQVAPAASSEEAHREVEPANESHELAKAA